MEASRNTYFSENVHEYKEYSVIKTAVMLNLKELATIKRVICDSVYDRF